MLRKGLILLIAGLATLSACPSVLADRYRDRYGDRGDRYERRYNPESYRGHWNLSQDYRRYTPRASWDFGIRVSDRGSSFGLRYSSGPRYDYPRYHYPRVYTRVYVQPRYDYCYEPRYFAYGYYGQVHYGFGYHGRHFFGQSYYCD